MTDQLELLHNAHTRPSPYDACPIYENNEFLLRLVTLEDAHALLACYGNETAFPFFNSDNCNSDFNYNTLAEMTDCINFWLQEYANRYYVRFAIFSKTANLVIGTIEIFNRGQLANYHNVGMLRIDICPNFENTTALESLLHLIHREIPRAFELEYLLTKAIPKANERIEALTARGYQPVPDKSLLPYSDYYLKSISNSATQNMGYCGLVCELCLESETCSGCKQKNNCCPEHNTEEGCSVYHCCQSKGIDGCWACNEAPCDKPIFVGDNHMRNRVFVQFAKAEGVAHLVKCVMTNHANGIAYGYGKDYDLLPSETAIVALLKKGE